MAPINIDMVKWYSRIAKALTSGAIITIDYELNWESQFSTIRSFGLINPNTKERKLECQNPLQCIGKQDITSDIDFGILEQVGREHGLTTHYNGDEIKLLKKYEPKLRALEQHSYTILIQVRS